MGSASSVLLGIVFTKRELFPLFDIYDLEFFPFGEATRHRWVGCANDLKILLVFFVYYLGDEEGALKVLHKETVRVYKVEEREVGWINGCRILPQTGQQ